MQVFLAGGKKIPYTDEKNKGQRHPCVSMKMTHRAYFTRWNQHKSWNKMNRLYILITIITLSASVQAQSDNVWKSLSKITYRKEYDELMGFKIDKPVFSDAIKSMEGKTIVKGYIIPVEGYKSPKGIYFLRLFLQHVFLLWWCRPRNGHGSECQRSGTIHHQQITLTGTLRLNSDDINRLMFKIDHAVPRDKSERVTVGYVHIFKCSYIHIIRVLQTRYPFL